MPLTIEKLNGTTFKVTVTGRTTTTHRVHGIMISRMAKKPLWRCPKCGHEFVTRNMWHSCARHRIDDHFAGKDPAVRELFDRFRAFVESCGPVKVYANVIWPIGRRKIS